MSIKRAWCAVLPRRVTVVPRGDIGAFELATITPTAKVESIYIRADDLRDHVRPVRQHSGADRDVQPCRQHLDKRERGIGFIRVAMRASNRRRILVDG